MQAKAQKWGNSLAVRIPGILARECGIEENTPVELRRRNNEIVITPQIEEYTLDDLLRRITPDNLPVEPEQWPSAGRELS